MIFLSNDSIRGKLLVIILMTTLSALLVSGGIILAHDLNAYRESRINDLTTQAELLAASTAPALAFDDAAVTLENLNLLRTQPSISAAAIYNSRGNLFAEYARSGGEASFPRLPGEEGVAILEDGMVMYKRIIENEEILGTVYLLGDYEVAQRVYAFLKVFGLVLLGAMLAAAVVSWRLQSSFTRPIRSIVEVAGKVVSDKDYSLRATKLSNDEVGILVDAFNEMLDEIHEQTQALATSNERLQQEIEERSRAREEILALNDELERKVLERTRSLEVTNQELESFCYSVSHDLRAPLRSISGFSQALKDEIPQEEGAEETRRYLDKIIAAAIRMSQLIEDLLNLSRISRSSIAVQEVDFSSLTNVVVQELKSREPGREVDVSVWDGMKVSADPKLVQIILENLLNNAWKFTSKVGKARIEVGCMVDDTRQTYYVRDNGAGFDMAYSKKLFGAFQRLHGSKEFPGTGIGLATVQRIINRHGGRIWANSSPDNGAVFYFTLQADASLGERNVDAAEEMPADPPRVKPFTAQTG